MIYNTIKFVVKIFFKRTFRSGGEGGGLKLFKMKSVSMTEENVFSGRNVHNFLIHIFLKRYNSKGIFWSVFWTVSTCPPPPHR